MKALHKDFWMEIRKSKARFISIFFIVALGVAFFSGIQASSPDMRLTGDAYYDSAKLMDIKIMGTLGLTDEDVAAVEAIEGVESAEGSWSTDVLCQEGESQKVLHIESVDETVNQLTVTEGRFPEKSGELFMDVIYAQSQGYEIGDTIVLKQEEDSELLLKETYTVVGIGSSPLYISFERGNTTLGSGEINGFAYVLPEDFDQEIYTQIYVTVHGAKGLTSYTDGYDNLIDKILDRVEGIEEARCQFRYDTVMTTAQEELSDARKELKKGKKKARRELKEARQELEDGEQELSDGRREYEDGVQQLAEAEQQLSDAKITLADARTELSDGEAQLAAAKTKLADGRSQLAEAQKELDSGIEEYNKQKKKFEKGESRFKAGKKEWKEGSQKLAEAKAKLESSQAEIDSGKEQLAAGKAQLTETKTDLNTKRQQCVDGLAQVEAAETQLAQGEAGLEAFRAQVAQETAALQDQIEILRQQYEEGAGSGALSEEELAALQEQIDGLNQAVTALQTKLAEEEAKLAASREALAAQRSTLEGSLAQIDAGLAELSQKEAELTQTEAALEAGQAEIDKGWNELAPQEEKLNAAKEELDKNEKTIQSGRKELKAAKKKLDDGQAEIDRQWDSIYSGEAEIAANEQKLSDARQQIIDGEQEITDGEQEIAENRQKLEDAKKEIEEGEKELEDGWKEYEDGKKEAEEEIADGEQKIADAQKEIDDIEQPEWIISDRHGLPEYTDFGDNADRMRSLGEVFPVIFFLVAALISLTTMTRMVEEQRTQIGTMKALGYGKYAIASKYLNYAFLATIGGSVLGFLIGQKLFPYIIITAYGIMYHNMSGSLQIHYEWSYALIASFASIICTIGATIFSCYRALAETPAALMRPPAPKEGKRILLERITVLWKHLSFTWKSSLRNLFRYKKRLLMTIFGIAGSMGLMLVGFGLYDSIMDVALLQYEELQHYDATIIAEEDAGEKEKQELRAFLDETEEIERYTGIYLNNLTSPNGKKNLSIYVYVPESLEGFQKDVTLKNRVTGETYELTDEGAVISEKTADLLELSPGDVFEIEKENKRYETTVAAVTENYMGHYVYMTPQVYEQTFGEQPEFSSIVFTMKEDGKDQIEKIGNQILKFPAALSISYTDSLLDQLERMLSTLGSVIVVLIVSAGMLAFVVLYNLNNINITERQRELATLKVLGFYDGEISQYVFRENIILTLLGVIAGGFFGIFLHNFVITTVEVEAVMFGRNIKPLSFVYSGLITCGFSLFVNMVMHFKLKKIDMVESLKSVE